MRSMSAILAVSLAMAPPMLSADLDTAKDRLAAAYRVSSAAEVNSNKLVVEVRARPKDYAEAANRLEAAATSMVEVSKRLWGLHHALDKVPAGAGPAERVLRAGLSEAEDAQRAAHHALEALGDPDGWPAAFRPSFNAFIDIWLPVNEAMEGLHAALNRALAATARPRQQNPNPPGGAALPPEVREAPPGGPVHPED